MNNNIYVRGEIEVGRTPDLTKEHEAERQEDSSHEQRKYFIEKLTLFVVVIYAGLTAWQGYSTKKSADAAKNAADAASGTLRMAREQFRIEERPYLSPHPRGGYETIEKNGQTTSSIFAITKGNNVDSAIVAVDFQNDGRSPAIEVVTTGTIYIVGPSSEAIKKAKDYRPDYSKSSPSVVIMNNAFSPASETLKMPKEGRERIRNGTAMFYVVGGVKYRDMFSPTIEPYETTYCYELHASGLPFANCNFSSPDFHAAIK
jgi:hypothetical protein